MSTISKRCTALAVAAAVVVAGVATAGPALAATSTSTSTGTGTGTGTSSGTGTSTSTGTGTGTSTGTSTSSATGTSTATGTPSPTATGTPTSGATATPTSGATATPTLGASTPATPTPTATPRPSVTAPTGTSKAPTGTSETPTSTSKAPTATSTTPANGIYKGLVKAGTVLQPGHQLTSPNGQFQLILQGDGNLVEYGIGRRVLWASNTANRPGATARFGTNGQIAILQGKKVVAHFGKSSKTVDFVVRDDGDIAGRNAAHGLLWRMKTFQSRLVAGDVLLPGTRVRSDADSGRWFVMQTNGDLQQFNNRKLVWNSITGGNPGATARLQSDGNLVIYTKAGKAIWASNTSGTGAGQLFVQMDANVVMYGSAGTRVWSTKPVTKMLWPVVSHDISGRYGDDRGPGHTPRYHQGTDAAVGIGTPVYASGSGVVTTATSSASYGNYVVVTYGATTVLVAHLSVIEVSKGQYVSPGTELAKSGNTGQSTGPHVHVETRVNGVLQDPLGILTWR